MTSFSHLRTQASRDISVGLGQVRSAYLRISILVLLPRKLLVKFGTVPKMARLKRTALIPSLWARNSGASKFGHGTQRSERPGLGSSQITAGFVR